MRFLRSCTLILFIFTFGLQAHSDTSNQGGFSLSFTESVSDESLDGRLLLILATDSKREPRFQINYGYKSAQIFGIDVNGLKAGETALITNDTYGFPVESLSNVPTGDYYAQAVLHKYDTFNLSTGHTVKLPMDQGEGQHWNRSPGNLYSTPQKIHIEQGQSTDIQIVLDQKIPPIEQPEDTKYVKHIKMKSELLSKFWGRDMFLGAHVLLPKGFDEHPDVKYPLVIEHGHYPHDFGMFGADPTKGLHKEWISADFPRLIYIFIQHPNPYYDDSYAVNSANIGPYGDAITYELVPHIEKMFRGIGEGWARFVLGGSTGGWESAAAQIFYPDEYNGAFIAYGDSVDFRAFELINIYDDDNAYYQIGPFAQLENPSTRSEIGRISSTVALENHLELVLGTKSRSGLDWDAWEAVYSPQGEDGYPQRIWDKKTGEINHEVADYWRENFDLRYILERDWATLGPKLEGKLNFYVGDMDNFYLNNAVYLMEDFLEKTTNPYYGGEIQYGDREEHGWGGNFESDSYYHYLYIDKIMKRIDESAPKGADVTSWKY